MYNNFFNSSLRTITFLLSFIFWFKFSSEAQKCNDFAFEYNFSIIVKDTNNKNLDYAWVGGLNSVHFGKIDINLDNVEDLIIFDKHGNKLLPFINLNIPGEFSYVYAPQYVKFFPSISDWFIFYDFNNDNKKDIFTYTRGGIKVFENTSNTTLQFELYTNLLLSKQYDNYINIYVTEADYPVIDDIDNDGDVDVLAFFSLGRYVEWHRNMGKELHGNPNIIDLHRTQRCWGNFLKREGSDFLFLEIDCPWGPNKQRITKEDKLDKFIMHPGHTMAFIDLTGDGLKEFLLGNIDLPNLIMLTNVGKPDSAHFISQNFQFPSNTKPVNLFSAPVIFYSDINNDQINELLISSFNPEKYIAENKKSIWLYNNKGNNTSTRFEFVTESFLQEEMIDVGSGAYPLLYDYNKDGLLDLFVSNYGVRQRSYYVHGHLHSDFVSKIALFENIGTATQPEFKLITDDFANLSKLKLQSLYPAIADLNGDNNADILLGNKDGTLFFIENIFNNNDPVNSIEKNFQNISVGEYAAPALFDLNEDGLLDLVIGNREGTFHYYQNVGTTSKPEFVLITRNLGGVNVVDLNHSHHGYSAPTLYKDDDNNIHLFCGTESGYILHYKNITKNFETAFETADTLCVYYDDYYNEKIKVGWRSAIAIAKIDNDKYPDAIIGNFSGGLNYFEGIKPIKNYIND